LSLSAQASQLFCFFPCRSNQRHNAGCPVPLVYPSSIEPRIRLDAFLASSEGESAPHGGGNQVANNPESSAVNMDLPIGRSSSLREVAGCHLRRACRRGSSPAPIAVGATRSRHVQHHCYGVSHNDAHADPAGRITSAGPLNGGAKTMAHDSG
jgi:hypothetical protein